MSCGCYKDERSSEVHGDNLAGKRFNRLTAIELVGSRITDTGNKSRVWRCRCDCGNVVDVYAGNLKRGNTKSCGCLNKELAHKRFFHDLTGNRYGYLTVIERDSDYVSPSGNTNTVWKCKCDCGTTKSIMASSLVGGLTLSCGCMRFSIGETSVRDALVSHNVEYATQYCFKGLIGPGGLPLRFDFAILKSGNLVALIEYQGRQHYDEYTPKTWPDFGRQQREITDPMKREYCMSHNIPLFEIRYDDDVSKAVESILTQLNIPHGNPVPSGDDVAEGATTIS